MATSKEKKTSEKRDKELSNEKKAKKLGDNERTPASERERERERERESDG